MLCLPCLLSMLSTLKAFAWFLKTDKNYNLFLHTDFCTFHFIILFIWYIKLHDINNPMSHTLHKEIEEMTIRSSKSSTTYPTTKRT